MVILVPFIVVWLMYGVVSAISVLIAVAILSLLVLGRRRQSRIVECTNCGFRMTHRRFRDNGGCVRCGTDLFVETGTYPRNWLFSGR